MTAEQIVAALAKVYVMDTDQIEVLRLVAKAREFIRAQPCRLCGDPRGIGGIADVCKACVDEMSSETRFSEFITSVQNGERQ